MLGTYYGVGTPSNRYLYRLSDSDPADTGLKINIPKGVSFIIHIPNSQFILTSDPDDRKFYDYSSLGSGGSTRSMPHNGGLDTMLICIEYYGF